VASSTGTIGTRALDADDAVVSSRLHPSQQPAVSSRVVAELPRRSDPPKAIDRRHRERLLVGVDADCHTRRVASLRRPTYDVDEREDTRALGASPTFYQVTSAGPGSGRGDSRNRGHQLDGLATTAEA
jgi:hypothetical protein